MRRSAAAVLAAVLVVGLPAPARAAEPVEFLDMRPVVIDLDTARVGQRWRVPIVDGQDGTGHAVFLTVSFRPDGVLRPVTGRLTTGAGDVADFVVELRRRVPGSGELIVSSGGTIVRRPISTTFRAGRSPVPISRLQFSGVRLAPFSDQVRVGSVSVPGATGSGTDLRPVAGRIGLLTSHRGDTAEVVRQSDVFDVRGATETGEFQGSVDLLPDRPGAEAEATLRVRDLPLWPLLVLLAGLLLVQVLDRYQHRRRPRQVLHLRLARLRDRAQAAGRRTGLAYRIVAQPGEPGLLLDRQVADVLARFDEQLTDADRAAWEADGSEYRRVADLVDSFETLTEAAVALDAERRASDEPVREALDRSPVGAALRGREVRSAADLTDAAAGMTAARTYLRDFQRLYRTATEMGADDVLAKLRTGPATLTGIEAELEEAFRTWRPDRAQPRPRPVPYPPVTVGSGPPQARQATRGRAGLAWVAAVVLLVPCVGGLFFVFRPDRNPDSSPTTAPTASAAPSPSPSRTAALPEIPVSPPATPAPADSFGPSEPSLTELVLYGGVLPLALAGVVAAAAWWAYRRRRPDPAALDAAFLDRAVRRADRRFAVAGGALVVLGGMSVLYAGNPTFGSAGDYLGMALWATVFGEGLSLARRLWPMPGGA